MRYIDRCLCLTGEAGDVEGVVGCLNNSELGDRLKKEFLEIYFLSKVLLLNAEKRNLISNNERTRVENELDTVYEMHIKTNERY